MTPLDWDTLMARHPVFGVLGTDDLSRLTGPEIAREVIFDEGETIMRQGELGRSVYMIGQGSATVSMRRGDKDQVELYAVGRGEMCGEMALIEERPRAATITASEKVIALEIDGDAFIRLLKERPEASFLMLGKICRRLRYTNSKVLEQQISGLDETVSMMNNRIDSALVQTEANLTASQAMFDQTKLRTNEIIESADRSRTQMKWLGGIIITAITLLGGLGLWNFKETVSERLNMVNAEIEGIKQLRADAQADFKTFSDDANEQLAELRATVDEAKAFQAEARQLKVATVRNYERMEAKLEADKLLAEIAAMKAPAFTDDTLGRLSTVVEIYDEQVIRELAGIFTSHLAEGMQYHGPLNSILRDGRVAGDRGVAFLSYVGALSAIKDSAAAPVYNDFRRRLEKLVENAKAGDFFRVSDEDRELLQYLYLENGGTAAYLPAPRDKIGEIVDLMQRLNAI